MTLSGIVVVLALIGGMPVRAQSEADPKAESKSESKKSDSDDAPRGDQRTFGLGLGTRALARW